MSENVTIIVQPQVQSVTVEVAQQVQEVTIEVGAYNGAGITDHTQLTSIGIFTHDELDAHLNSIANPHQVTKLQVGLGNVDDTSDAMKPLSDAMTTALGLKADSIHSHAIGDVTGLVTALSGKVDNSRVLTDVPLGALFTDTIYDDTALQSLVGTKLSASDIDTLLKLNTIITDANLISDTDARLSDARTPTAHVHIISEVTGLQTALNNKVDDSQVLTDVPLGAIFTDTIYDDTIIWAAVNLNTAKISATGNEVEFSDINTLAGLNSIVTDADLIASTDARLSDARTPVAHSHPISDITGLQTALNGKVDDSQVLTNVPAGALFTDTIYNDADVLKDADALSPVTALNKLITQTDLAGLGGGDMLKSVYDTNNSGKVDDAEKVNGLTVGTAVPVGALFTDTVYDDTTIWAAVNLNTAKVSFPGFATLFADYGFTDNSTNWNTAYGWGNHALQGYLTAVPLEYLTQTEGDARYLQTYTETDPIFTAWNKSTGISIVASQVTDFDTEVANNTAVALNTAKVSYTDATKVALISVTQAVNLDTMESDIAANNAKISATGNELEAGDIDTLAKLNLIITDTDLISTTDSRLSDARTPTAHTHTASQITDFDTEVANNTAVALNTAKISYTDAAKVANITVTQAVNLDTMESDIAANNAKVTNAEHTGEVTGATALTIASGVVDIDNLAAELKATTALGSVSGTVNINWALGIQFNFAMTAATTLTFSNMAQGKTITLIVTGNFALTLPASVKGDVTGFDGTKTNQIQLYCFDSTTPQCSVGILNW